LPPTIAPGKISYIQIPALDVDRSAAFYETVFGWNIRRRGDGEVAFDDTVGEVSGNWGHWAAALVGARGAGLCDGR
jgi:predicted enzyme related to lactoylglutathione lyase